MWGFFFIIGLSLMSSFFSFIKRTGRANTVDDTFLKRSKAFGAETFNSKDISEQQLSISAVTLNGC